MKKFKSVISVILALAIACCSFGCSSSKTEKKKSKSKKEKKKTEETEEVEKIPLVIYNWGEYIGEDTIGKFEEAYPQYNVVYRTFETNETMYATLDNSYDVIIPSDYMVCRLISEEKIQPIDWSKIPNVSEYMDSMFYDINYGGNPDVNYYVLDYAVPYLYCTVGLVYDANKIDIPEGTTDPKVIWGVLFDEANEGKIGMYDSQSETIGVALNYLGYSINSTDDQELQAALNLLIRQKDNMSPEYGIDRLKDMMASGELSASVAWSGDYFIELDRIEEIGNGDIDLRFALPDNSSFSTDLMCIPANANNVQGAYDFINFMYDPEIAADNCEYVGYSTPNVAAKNMLDPAVVSNEYFYPSRELMDALEVYAITDEINEKHSLIWNEFKLH